MFRTAIHFLLVESLLYVYYIMLCLFLIKYSLVYKFLIGAVRWRCGAVCIFVWRSSTSHAHSLIESSSDAVDVLGLVDGFSKMVILEST